MHRAEARYGLPSDDDDLLLRHGKLIDRAARRLAARVGLSDGGAELWSAGALGLLDAARRFDDTRSVRFESFAEHRIRGAMLDELRNMDHLPRRLRADTERVGKERRRLHHALGREPESEELAKALGLGLSELAELELLSQRNAPLSEALGVASPEENAEVLVGRRQVAQRLSKGIERLSVRLQQLLSLYYVEELTFREIAGMLELSEARVCQLHREAVQALRVDLGSAPE